MFSLVFYIKSKTKDIIKESDFVKFNGLNKISIVKHGYRQYEAIVLKRHVKSENLESIEVNKNGEIISDVDQQIINMKNKKKESKKQNEIALKKLSAEIQGQSSIFQEDLCEEMDTETVSINGSVREEIENESDLEFISNDQEVNGDKNVTSCIEHTQVMQKVALTLIELAHELQKNAGEQCDSDPHAFLKVLPGYKKKKGTVELKANSGLYIDKMDLSDALRFKKRPSEMARRLIVSLCSEDYLKKMTPHGNKNKPAIPAAIKETVFWFINKNAEEKLEAKDFYKTLSNKCTTLRNPKISKPKVSNPVVKKKLNLDEELDEEMRELNSSPRISETHLRTALGKEFEIVPETNKEKESNGMQLYSPELYKSVNNEKIYELNEKAGKESEPRPENGKVHESDLFSAESASKKIEKKVLTNATNTSQCSNAERVKTIQPKNNERGRESCSGNAFRSCSRGSRDQDSRSQIDSRRPVFSPRQSRDRHSRSRSHRSRSRRSRSRQHGYTSHGRRSRSRSHRSRHYRRSRERMNRRR